MPDGPLYAGVFLAAAIEGEIVFVTASIAVAMGRLDFWGVLIAGALGGSAGDQFFFYAFRGRLRGWLNRFPRIGRHHENLTTLVRRYAIPLTAACRFLPGLRVAIPAACASAAVSPWLFSSISIVSAFVWAGCIVSLVGWAGPQALDRLGIARNLALGISGMIALIVFFALKRISLEGPPTKRE